MSYWNEDNPAKPRGIKDPDAVLDYPINFNDWLTAISDTYASHAVTTSGTLVCDSSACIAGIITVWLSGGTLGETETFTVRITTAGGRIDDRTYYLKISER